MLHSSSARLPELASSQPTAHAPSNFDEQFKVQHCGQTVEGIPGAIS